MTTRHYFAYGAHMWKDYMRDRCPDSQFVGKGSLPNWEWMINVRGYANVAPSEGMVVHGLLYLISKSDEDSLDALEALPEISWKDIKTIQTDGGPIQALVYFDKTRTGQGRANNEYIGRMSNAVEDALKAGVSEDYIRQNIRPFIPKLTFGYGTNMWKEQMRFRCPQSSFLGVGSLANWKWIIHEWEVANVVQSQGDIVYGLLYALSEADEENLDKLEGPRYTKCMKKINVADTHGNTNSYVTAFVYIDEERTSEGAPRPEYIGRINNGIADALGENIPHDYIEKYLRPFMPTLYFAYGTHMSSAAMTNMAPRRWTFSKVGVLPGWKWNINHDGYANIVPSAQDVVYGIIYEVDQGDETQLDELAHPYYTKHLMRVETLKGDKYYARNHVNVLVYIDERAGSGIASPEYVNIMNRAIREATGVAVRLPKKYVDQYIRQHILFPGPRA